MVDMSCHNSISNLDTFEVTLIFIAESFASRSNRCKCAVRAQSLCHARARWLSHGAQVKCASVHVENKQFLAHTMEEEEHVWAMVLVQKDDVRFFVEMNRWSVRCNIDLKYYEHISPVARVRMELGIDVGDRFYLSGYDWNEAYILQAKDLQSQTFYFQGHENDLVVRRLVAHTILVRLEASLEASLEVNGDMPLVRVEAFMAASGEPVGTWQLPGSGDLHIHDVCAFVRAMLPDAAWGPHVRLRYVNAAAQILGTHDVFWSPPADE